MAFYHTTPRSEANHFCTAASVIRGHSVAVALAPVVDPPRESWLVRAARERLPVLAMCVLLGGTHTRLETRAALGDWTCAVLQLKEQPGRALPYRKPGRVNTYAEDRGGDTRHGWKNAGDKSSYQSCWREAADTKHASSACAVFLPPPPNVQGTATGLLSVLRGWIGFVLALKTAPVFVQPVFTLWWRSREALSMEQTSATDSVVPSHGSPSEDALCYTGCAPAQRARAETLPARCRARSSSLGLHRLRSARALLTVC